MLTITQEIKRLEALLNGEIVEGLRLGDPGLGYEWAVMRIAALRELKPVRRERREQTASNITLRG